MKSFYLNNNLKEKGKRECGVGLKGPWEDEGKGVRGCQGESLEMGGAGKASQQGMLGTVMGSRESTLLHQAGQGIC